MLLSFLLLLQQPADAQTIRCDQEKADQGIQLYMNLCAAEEFKAANDQMLKQLKITLDKQLERESNFGKDSPDNAGPDYVKSLLNAQGAWRKFRKAHCAGEGYAAWGGSLQSLLVSTCKTALTEQRIQQLKELAKEY